MISLIESAVSFLYRNFTSEGKITQLPRKIEAIEAMLSLEDKLQEAGVDTTDMKDNIQKSSVLISQQLNNLSCSEPIVKINGRTHSVGDALEKAYLESSRNLILEEAHVEETESH